MNGFSINLNISYYFKLLENFKAIVLKFQKISRNKNHALLIVRSKVVALVAFENGSLLNLNAGL
jgi:hypothetical protein